MKNNLSLIVLDIGTSSVRAFLYSKDRRILATKSNTLKISYPKLSWAEQDPEELWLASFDCLKYVMNEANKQSLNILGIGISNQRETSIAWCSNTHKSLYPAIVWQCRRTADYCSSLKDHHDLIKQKTGLFCDPYFSATKFEWLLKNVPEVQKANQSNCLKLGTVDSWIIWKLTQGQSHFTDSSNASRTMLYNIHSHKYDRALLNLFSIDINLLPEVRPSLGNFGIISFPDLQKIPIVAVLGDQQASLFAHYSGNERCIKNTYGTGLFLMACTGNKVQESSKLITTIAWTLNNETSYALEGSIFSGASTLKWLINNLKILEDDKKIDSLVNNIDGCEGLLFVPALSGLGSPFWSSTARGSFVNISTVHRRAHFCRAVLEALAYHSKTVFDEIKKTIQLNSFDCLCADGGLSNSAFLMQFQSRVLNLPVKCALDRENTAQGILNISGLFFDLWDLKTLRTLNQSGEIYYPKAPSSSFYSNYDQWLIAVHHSIALSKSLNE